MGFTVREMKTHSPVLVRYLVSLWTPSLILSPINTVYCLSTGDQWRRWKRALWVTTFLINGNRSGDDQKPHTHSHGLEFLLLATYTAQHRSTRESKNPSDSFLCWMTDACVQCSSYLMSLCKKRIQGRVVQALCLWNKIYAKRKQWANQTSNV